MLTYVCVLSILFSLLSCSSEVSNENEKFRTCNELEISIIDTIKLPLDSVTPSATTMSQKIEEYYTFLSYGKPKRILFYDITTQIPVRSLYVGDLMDNVSGYLIHNLDSIFLFSYATNSIKLINSQEEVLNHWKLPPFRRGYLNSPRILTGRPMLIKDGKIYCGGIGTGKPPEDQKIITEIDMITKKVSTFMEYPAFYHQSNWGGAYFRYTYMTKDFNSDFLISYPASHFIYKTPDFKKMDSFYGGSGEIKKYHL